MAQSFEVTEVSVNGNSHKTALTKSYNSFFVKNTKVNGSGCELELLGRATKDVRIVSESNAAVLAAANAAPTTTIEKLLAVTVKSKQGDLESRITPYAMSLSKNTIVEYYADPNDAADTIVIVAREKNTVERIIYTVDETYAAIKAKFLL